MSIISEIQIVPVKPHNGLIGFVSFVLNDAFYCGSIGIMTRPGGGYRLVYPTKKVAGKDIDVYHPINRHIGQIVEEEVTKKINEVMSVSNGRYDSVGVAR